MARSRGCRTVLVADPEQRTVTVYRSLDVIDGADVAPGWRLPVAELFA